MKLNFNLRLVGGLLILLGTSLGHAEDSVAKPGDSLNSQVSVTRDALNQVLEKLREGASGSDPKYQHPDFLAAAARFNVLAEAALIRFEAEVQPIYQEMMFHVGQLRDIEKSTAYSTEQADALLRDYLKISEVALVGLSSRYRDAFYRLYTTGFPEIDGRPEGCEYVSRRLFWGDDFLNFSIWKKGSHDHQASGRLEFSSKKSCETYVETGDFRSDLSRFYRFRFSAEFNPLTKEKLDFDDELFNEQIVDQCFSISCISLLTAHRLAFISLVDQAIDKEKRFRFTLPSWHTYAELSLRNLDVPVRLKRILTLRPSDLEGLPFSISEQEYQQKIRIAPLKEIQELLINQPGGFIFSKFECPVKLKPLLKSLCDSQQGCLTRAEEDDIAKAINASSGLSKKSERIQCLQGGA